MKIQIKNFCNIEDLFLELYPGITCIRGASNAGKSALTHAIRALVYNKHSDAKIMHGKDAYMVGIIDGENKVICKRNKNMASKTSYQVNGVTLTKVGRNAIPEVQDALNIKDIEILKTKTEMNFAKQFAFPFLLDKTPSQLYDFLASSESSNDLNSIVKDMKADLKEIADQQKRLEGAIDMAKAMYEKEQVRYSNLTNSDLLVTSILSKSGEVKSVEQDKSLLEAIETQSRDIEFIETQFNKVNLQHQILANVEELITRHDNNANLMQAILDIASVNKQGVEVKTKLQEINSVDLDLDSLEKRIDKYYEDNKQNVSLGVSLEELSNLNNSEQSLISSLSSISKAIEPLSLMESKLNQYTDNVDLGNKIEDVESLNKSLEECTFELNALLEQIKEIDKELKEFKVCPICNSTL